MWHSLRPASLRKNIEQIQNFHEILNYNSDHIGVLASYEVSIT